MNDRITIIEDRTNCAVVQLGNRRFPGIVIQGDTLHALTSLSKAAVNAITAHEQEAESIAQELHQSLLAYLSVFENVMNRQKLPLPYNTSPD